MLVLCCSACDADVNCVLRRYGDGVAGLAGVTETSTDDDYADPNAEIGYMDTADNSGYMDVPAGDDEDEDY